MRGGGRGRFCAGCGALGWRAPSPARNPAPLSPTWSRGSSSLCAGAPLERPPLRHAPLCSWHPPSCSAAAAAPSPHPVAQGQAWAAADTPWDDALGSALPPHALLRQLERAVDITTGDAPHTLLRAVLIAAHDTAAVAGADATACRRALKQVSMPPPPSPMPPLPPLPECGCPADRYLWYDPSISEWRAQAAPGAACSL